MKSRSLTHKTLHTFATLFIGQAAFVAAGVATAHAYGPVGKGIITFAGVLLTFAATTAEGLKNAIAFQVGKESQDLRSVWYASRRLMAVLAPIGTIVFLGLYARVPSQPAFLYVALAFPFAMYVQAIGIVYILRDRVEEINVKNSFTIGAGSSIATLVAVLVFHAPVWGAMAVIIAANVAGSIWNTVGLKRLFTRPDGPANEAWLVRQQAVFTAKSALSANVTFLAQRIDVFIVSAMLAPASLGIYTLAVGTGEVLWQVSRAIVWSSTGRVATLELGPSAELVARVVRSLLFVQLLAGIALFITGPWLIAHVYGGRFAASGFLLRLLLPGVVLYSADGMFSFFIGVRAGKPSLLLAIETTTLVVCGTLAFLALPRFGLAGAAAAESTSRVIAFVVKTTFFMRLGGVPLGRILVPRVTDVPTAIALRLRAFLPRPAAQR